MSAILDMSGPRGEGACKIFGPRRARFKLGASKNQRDKGGKKVDGCNDPIKPQPKGPPSRKIRRPTITRPKRSQENQIVAGRIDNWWQVIREKGAKQGRLPRSLSGGKVYVVVGGREKGAPSLGKSRRKWAKGNTKFKWKRTDFAGNRNPATCKTSKARET